MLVSMPIVFFISVAVSVISSLLLLHSKIPLRFVRMHIVLHSLPPVIVLVALNFHHKGGNFGPWRFDHLSWILALFVLTVGLIVQRYSVHYLLGDRHYRKYFALLTITTSADALAWLSDDLRLLLVCWGITLLGLTLLIGLRKEWQVARQAAAFTGRMFALSWIILSIVIIWVTQATGHWELSVVLSEKSLAQLASWEKTLINLLFILSVMIPAAQWPFQRWLLDSVVAPTPISAVMHAGIVNAGGIMLTRFAPFFNGDPTQIVLLVIASLSVLIGTGMMLVQVDYKRQLVGSTIAQMGFMLIQCALGAYLAAIIHAILHGLFKSTLFLQAGSAIRHHDPNHENNKSKSYIWSIMGVVSSVMVGVGYWLQAPFEAYRMISAVALGWSVFLAWTQLVVNGNGHIARMVGISIFAGAAFVYMLIHTVFYKLLEGTIHTGEHPHAFTAISLVLVLLIISSLGAWLTRNRTSTAFAVIYLWFVRLGEPHRNLVESHPKYLTQILSRGGK
ncbi:MAG: NADH dehydrogenase subunit 5 [Bacillus sp. (in: firmicutes)]